MTTQQQHKYFITNFYKVSNILKKPSNERTKILFDLVKNKYISKSIITNIQKDMKRYNSSSERIKNGIYKKFKKYDEYLNIIYQNKQYKPQNTIKNITDFYEYGEKIKFEIDFIKLVERKRTININKNKESIIQHLLVEPKNKLHSNENKDGHFGVIVDNKNEISASTAEEIIENKYNEKFNKDIHNIVYRLFKKTEDIFKSRITNQKEIDERLKEIKRIQERNKLLEDLGVKPTEIPPEIKIKHDEMTSFNIQFLVLQELEPEDEETPSKYIIFHSPINMKIGDTNETNNKENNKFYFYYIDEKGTKRDVDFNYYRNITSDTSSPFIIGFTVYITYNDGSERLKEPDIYKLKAFSSKNNSVYHTLTEYSTNNNKLCIYESYLYNIGIIDAKYKTEKNKILIADELNNLLQKESKEIQENIKEGNLIKSLNLLTEKYKKPTFITFYNSKIKQSLKVFNNNFTFVNEDEVIKEYALLYCEKDQHIAPRKRNHNFNIIIDNEDNNNNNSVYGLRKIKNEIKKNDLSNIKYILSYDIETYTNDQGIQQPFLICLYGLNNETNEIINNCFYGFNCVIDFVNYLISISTKLNHTKTHTTEKIKYIYIYGFNNSKFDNIYIFNEIKNNINYVDFTFSDNSIKYIEFDNIKIFDLSLYYSGSLKVVSKNFNLEETKGVYPYKFVNKNNLNYIGFVPDVDFWNNKDEYNEYINLNGYNFNLKEYTIKYCLLDCKLTYLIALEHLKLSIGTINNKNYNVSTCQTCSSLSMKLYNHSFQNEDLYQSPEKIYIKEKQSYKAGRVDVFKKSFNNNNDILYYFDRNSSYPASMIGEMPYKYISTNLLPETKIKYENIKDTNLYLSKSKYIGNNKNVIPNLLTRNKNKEIRATLETDWDYFWGVELKEAIKNDFEIIIKEVNIYETKILFKEFVEYLYNERQKNKNVNNSLYVFYKTILNSFSGKFGQKSHTQTKLLNNTENWGDYINKNTELIDIKFIGDNTLIKYNDIKNEDLTIGKLVRFISYITANARSNLSEIMRDVGHNNIYYCDTDSIFSSVKPSNKFLDNNLLGKWKIEDEIKEAYFIGKKSYTYKNIDNKIINKCKGVDASQITFNQYKNLTDENNIKVKKNMFYRSYNGVKIIETERTIKTTYKNRLFIGNSSTAFQK